MKYLLDTNVISSYARGKMNPRVDAWLERVDDKDLYISMITYAELWYGASLMPFGKRRTEIETWIEDELDMQFSNRTVSFSGEAARHYGRLQARAEKNGHTAGVLDTMIAAVAAAEGMTVATLNRKDFERLGVDIADF